MFDQTFELHDLFVLLLLVGLEGLLSMDNALVLGLLARQLPQRLQGKALTYGLFGALAFRFVAVITAALLLEWQIPKLIGGAYLVYVGLKHFRPSRKPHEPIPPADAMTAAGVEDAAKSAPAPHVPFWKTVWAIELTDVAFAVDSILAAIALVGSPPPTRAGSVIHPKLWLILTGGMIGVVLVRFAATMFIRLLGKFPRFEMSAYLMIIVVGTKMSLDYLGRIGRATPRFDFDSAGSVAWFAFWGLIVGCIALGFLPQKKTAG